MTRTSKNTSIFLMIALLASLLSFDANAAGAPSVSDGSVQVSPPRNATFTAQVNPNGSSTSLCIKYGTSSGALNQVRCYYGINSTLRAKIGLINLNEGATYYYQATAENSFGANSISGSFVMTIEGGSSNTGTNSGSNSSGSGTTPTPTPTSNSGSSGSGSSVAAQIPLIVTHGPSSVGINEAVVNGAVNPNNANTEFWFEFGTTQSLGKTTSVQTVGAGNAWKLVIGNLSALQPGKTYYYRVVAKNSVGTSRGGILTFVTQPLSAAKTGTGQTSGSGSVLGAVSGIDNTPTANGQDSLRPSFMSLEYSLSDGGALVVVADDTQPAPGDEFEYTVVYKNDTQGRYNEANVKIIIPVEAEFISSSIDPLKTSGNVIEFKLGKIESGDRGSVTVNVRIKETTKPGTNLVFASVLGYKDGSGVQLATTSYLTIRIAEGSSKLTASIGSLFGGIAKLVLILVTLIAIFSILYYRFIRKVRKAAKEEEERIEKEQLERQNKNAFEKVPSTFEPIEGINISYE
jgi:hypothetical protein